MQLYASAVSVALSFYHPTLALLIFLSWLFSVARRAFLRRSRPLSCDGFGDPRSLQVAKQF